MKLFNWQKPKIEELETLVSHLKKEKRQTKRNIKTFIEQITTQALQVALTHDKAFQNEPYLFVDRKGIILGYTNSLDKLEEFTPDIIGIDYLDVFYNLADNNVRREIKKYFESPDEKQIIYDKKNGKKRKFIITKEKPAILKDVDFSVLGNNHKVDIVAYVPIKIESSTLISRTKAPQIYEALGIDRKVMFHELVTLYSHKEASRLPDEEAISIYKNYQKNSNPWVSASSP